MNKGKWLFFTKYYIDRKRDMKRHDKEGDIMTTATTTNNHRQSGAGQDTTTEEEEDEEETANTAKTFKRFKMTETDEFAGFSTTSSSRDLGEAEKASSQGFDENTPGVTMSTNDSCNADEFIPAGERLAALYSGTLMSKETQNGRGGSKGLRFRCANSHEFTVSFDKLRRVPATGLDLETCKNIWCVKCHNFYIRCNKKASDNGAIITSKIFAKSYVEVNCRMNHSFKISVHRNPDKVWCTHCKKDVKNESRKEIERQKELQRQRDLEYQQKLFEESRKKMESDQAQQQAQQEQYSLQNILTQVEIKATSETQKFLRSGENTLSEEYVYSVYKTIYMPSEIIEASFRKLGESLNSCFRKMAVLVHPDKNGHPLANRAFQKLSNAYMVCKQR